MAILHVARTVHTSSSRKAGNAQARIVYITRQDERTYDPSTRQLRYIAGDREDLVYTNQRNFPQWAKDNPHVYFSAAETYEGGKQATHKNGKRIMWEEWKVTLPRELTHGENMKLTRDIIDAMCGKNIPVVYALHDPLASDQGQQPHLHIMLSTRKTDGINRLPSQHFKRWNASDPRRGGAQKSELYAHKGMVKAWRVMLSDITNLHLEATGKKERVFPETLQSQGIKRAPEPKIGTNGGQGVKQAVASIRARRDRQKELLAAQTYWNSRKAQLGIASTMTQHEKLQAIYVARKALLTQTPQDLKAAAIALRMAERHAAYEQHLQRRQEERRNNVTHRKYWSDLATRKKGLTPEGRIFDQSIGR